MSACATCPYATVRLHMIHNRLRYLVHGISACCTHSNVAQAVLSTAVQHDAGGSWYDGRPNAESLEPHTAHLKSVRAAAKQHPLEKCKRPPTCSVPWGSLTLVPSRSTQPEMPKARYIMVCCHARMASWSNLPSSLVSLLRARGAQDASRQEVCAGHAVHSAA